MSAVANKPVQVFRLKAVKVSVFENRAQDSVFHKFTVQKIYKDGDEWKTTNGLGRDDAPVACLLLQRAWEWILETEAGRSKDEESDARAGYVQG